MTDLRDILATPYRLDGDQQVGIGLSCFGTVREVARRLGLPPPEGWPTLLDDWRAGRAEISTGLPPGWQLQPAGTAWQQGDLLVFTRGGRPGCGIIDAGFVVSAEPSVGPYRLPIHRWRLPVTEVWRYRR